MAVMIVMKQTPRGMKLIPLSELRGMQGRPLSAGHPRSADVRRLMDFLMVTIRDDVKAGLRVTLKEAWDRINKQYGAEAFSEWTYLPASNYAVARVLLKGVA